MKLSIETTLTLALAATLFVAGVVIQFVAVRIYRLLRRGHQSGVKEAPALYPHRAGSRLVFGVRTFGAGVRSVASSAWSGIYRFVFKGVVPLTEYAIATLFSWTWGLWTRRILPLVRGEIQWVGDVLGQSMYGGVASASGALQGEDLGPFLHDGFGPTIEAERTRRSLELSSRRIVNISSSAWESRAQSNGSHNGYQEAETSEPSRAG